LNEVKQMNATEPLSLEPLPAVLRRLACSKGKLYKLIKTVPDFPKPVRVGGSIRFVSAEVNRYITGRMAERDGEQPKPPAVLVDEREAALAVGKSVSWLQKDRLQGTPVIPFVRVGSSVRYDLAAVREALK
jgi:predicted DNA-binding transcriptional regulator AlpA